MALEIANLFRLPYFGIGGGISTDFGAWLPRGSKAIFVRSTGVQSQDEQAFARKILPTLASGLLECRAGLGDTVFVLPGHSESVTDATMLANLVAGTRVVGLGDCMADDAPTFRWTNTAGQWAVAVKNCMFSNLRLRLEGANGITKAIAVTADGCAFNGNAIQVASGATAKAAIALSVGSGATNFRLLNNYIFGTATHNVTNGILVEGASVPSGLIIDNNRMIFSATAANGNVNITVAALNVQITENILYNTHTSSTANIAIADVAADGIMANNKCAVMNNGTATAQGIVPAGSSDTFKFFNNYCCDELNKSGILTPTAAT